MKIEGIVNSKQSYSRKRGQTIQRTGNVLPDNTRTNRDTLSVSKTGRAEAQEKTQSTTRRGINGQIKESPLEHQCRVERLKVIIENGTYSVPNNLVVDAIIRRAGEGS